MTPSEGPLPNPHDSDVTTQNGSTTSERFARVRSIFEAALERLEADRRSYIDGACVGDQLCCKKYARCSTRIRKLMRYSMRSRRCLHTRQCARRVRMKKDASRQARSSRAAIAFLECSAAAVWVRFIEPTILPHRPLKHCAGGLEFVRTWR
jgi:hypothetical protein